MSSGWWSEDYEVGYGKPPKSGQFQKGSSGNPKGRPKKEPDFGAELVRELNSKLVITENGRRRVITKYEGMVKQLVNKVLSGNLGATRVVIPHYKEELAKIAERRLRSPKTNPNLTARDMTTEELMAFLEEDAEQRIRPNLEKSIRASLQRSIRV